jgi:hypothetical protein
MEPRRRWLVHGCLRGFSQNVAAEQQDGQAHAGFPRDRNRPPRGISCANRAQSQVVELTGGHAIFLSHARDVAALIEKAAAAAK